MRFPIDQKPIVSHWIPTGFILFLDFKTTQTEPKNLVFLIPKNSPCFIQLMDWSLQQTKRPRKIKQLYTPNRLRTQHSCFNNTYQNEMRIITYNKMRNANEKKKPRREKIEFSQPFFFALNQTKLAVHNFPRAPGDGWLTMWSPPMWCVPAYVSEGMAHCE